MSALHCQFFLNEWFFLMYVRNFIVGIFFGVLAVLPSYSQPVSDPAELVSQVTADVLRAVQMHKDDYQTDPDIYYSAINDALGSNVNFERMAYLVMDATYYRASTAEQKARFVEVFEHSLVETYSRGLLSIDEAEFRVLPVDAPEGAQTVTVKQELDAGTAEVKLDYSMRREPDGRWLMVNVIIDGINLGSTFRNQFAQSARRFDGDLDLVIESWSSN